MAWESWVQSQVESYQRLKKWYLMPPCLTLSIKRYVSRVKWVNSGKGVAPSPTPWCSSYQKGSLWVTLDYGCQLYFLFVTWNYVIACKLLVLDRNTWNHINKWLWLNTNSYLKSYNCVKLLVLDRNALNYSTMQIIHIR